MKPTGRWDEMGWVDGVNLSGCQGEFGYSCGEFSALECRALEG